MNNESTTAFVNIGRGRAIHYARVYKYKDSNETTYYHVLCDGHVSDVRPARRQLVTCLRCKRALAAIEDSRADRVLNLTAGSPAVLVTTRAIAQRTEHTKCCAAS